MKASDKIKVSITIEEVYERVKSTSPSSEFKIFYPHFVYVSDGVKMQLIRDGFKLYEGDWIMGNRGLIIEW